MQAGEFILEYELRRSTRRSIGFMSDGDSLRVTVTEIDNTVRTKQGSILAQFRERRERRATRPLARKKNIQNTTIRAIVLSVCVAS